MKFDFVGDAYRARSLIANAQQTINLFPELDKKGKAVASLYGAPGLITKETFSGEIRALFSYDGVAYVLAANKVYSLDAGYNSTLIGTIATSTGYAKFMTNGLVILLIDGVSGYSYTLATGVFAIVSAASFPANPVAGDVLDTIFLVIEGGSQRFGISDDGTTWDSLDFASAESNADNLKTVIVDHQEVVFGGAESTEIWYNSGELFPFARRTVIETGMVSAGGICKADNSVFFIGNDKVIWRLNGYTPVRVSTHAIEYAIAQYDVSDCLMWAEKREGHLFIWCQFPTGDETWVYDVATEMWHRRAYRNTTSGALERHRANCYTPFANKHIVGDRGTGIVYELDMDTYTDAGSPLPAIRACRHIAGPSMQRVFHHSLRLDIEAGVGLTTGLGSDPQVMLRLSNDGGKTFGNGINRSMGRLGEFETHPRWSPLGAARDRVYWAEITDPVKRVITGAALDYTIGNS